MIDKYVFWILAVLLALNILFAVLGPNPTFNGAVAVFLTVVLGIDLYSGRTYDVHQ